MDPRSRSSRLSIGVDAELVVGAKKCMSENAKDAKDTASPRHQN